MKALKLENVIAAVCLAGLAATAVAAGKLDDMLPDERALAQSRNAKPVDKAGAEPAAPADKKEAATKEAPNTQADLAISSDQVSKVQGPTRSTTETIQQTADRVNGVEKRDTIIIQGRTPVPPLDDKPLAPGIPEPPRWLKEQERLEVQYFFIKRDLEREAELLKIRSEIAASEAAIRKAAKAEEETDKKAMMGSPRLQQNFGSQPFPQYISNLDGNAIGALPPPPPPPPPAPGPPTVKRVLGDYAVLSYDGNQFTVKAGDTLPGGYRVKTIAFNSVGLTSKTGDLTIAPQW